MLGPRSVIPFSSPCREEIYHVGTELTSCAVTARQRVGGRRNRQLPRNRWWPARPDGFVPTGGRGPPDRSANPVGPLRFPDSPSPRCSPTPPPPCAPARMCSASHLVIRVSSVAVPPDPPRFPPPFPNVPQTPPTCPTRRRSSGSATGRGLGLGISGEAWVA